MKLYEIQPDIGRSADITWYVIMISFNCPSSVDREYFSETFPIIIYATVPVFLFTSLW